MNLSKHLKGFAAVPQCMPLVALLALHKFMREPHLSGVVSSIVHFVRNNVVMGIVAKERFSANLFSFSNFSITDADKENRVENEVISKEVLSINKDSCSQSKAQALDVAEALKDLESLSIAVLSLGNDD